jgi:trans-L-3-hydroxyproline dehydratase
MCGHGIIAMVKVALETGLVPKVAPETTLRIDSPAGLITAHARIAEDRIQSIYFENVPSFVLALDEVVEVPEIGTVQYDLAFGGAFYAYVRATDIGLDCTPQNFAALVKKGMAIKRAIMASREITHPFEADLSFLYGTIFTGPAESSTAHSRHVCIFAEGEVDRSPTGTGVSGRLAICHARREVDIGAAISIESIIGTCFAGRIIRLTSFGPHAAVIPQVEGTAYITGRHEFLIDPGDPLKEGFILR